MLSRIVKARSMSLSREIPHDNKIGNLNFLQFDDEKWKKYNTPFLFQNRLRHQNFRKFF